MEELSGMGSRRPLGGCRRKSGRKGGYRRSGTEKVAEKVAAEGIGQTRWQKRWLQQGSLGRRIRDTERKRGKEKGGVSFSEVFEKREWDERGA